MAKQDAIVVSELVVPDDHRENRSLDIGDQHIQFRAPTGNILVVKAKEKALLAAIEIDSDEKYAQAAVSLAELKGTLTALDNMRKTVSEPLHKAKEANDAIYREPKQLIEAAVTKLTRSMIGYAEEVDRKRQAEQARAEREAEETRQRLAAQAAQAAAEAGEAATLGDAAAAEEKLQEADALEQGSNLVTAREVVIDKPKVAGTSTRYTYGATPPANNEERKAALKWFMDNPQFLNLVTFDMPGVNKLAVALKENFAIPGFKLEKKAGIATRGVKAIDII
jgi:hypothetical protein